MRMFNLFRRASAPIARERLQILLAHERMATNNSDLLGVLREEILAVISRHVAFEPERVQIKLDRGKSVSTLAVDIEIPNSFESSSLVPLQNRSSLNSDDSASGMQHSVG